MGARIGMPFHRFEMATYSKALGDALSNSPYKDRIIDSYSALKGTFVIEKRDNVSSQTISVLSDQNHEAHFLDAWAILSSKTATDLSEKVLKDDIAQIYKALLDRQAQTGQPFHKLEHSTYLMIFNDVLSGSSYKHAILEAYQALKSTLDIDMPIAEISQKQDIPQNTKPTDINLSHTFD